jgi:predicted RNA-binding Zn-ribbon protein involved in translation (DUF1610 family)
MSGAFLPRPAHVVLGAQFECPVCGIAYIRGELPCGQKVIQHPDVRACRRSGEVFAVPLVPVDQNWSRLE